MELLDYLQWRNDVPLSVSPFNEVDNIILAYLSYIDFGKLRQEWDGFCDLKELFQCFCKEHSLEEIKTAGQFTERAPLAERDDGRRTFSGYEAGILCCGF